MAYRVSTADFSGPFELMLKLVVRERLDVAEISLADIASRFQAEVAAMTQCDLEAATEFLLIAAALVEIKTRRMLPGGAEPDLEEELLRFCERDLLLARLVECHTFRDAAAALSRLAADEARSRPRRAGLNEDRFRELEPDVLEGVAPADLRAAYARAASASAKSQPRVSVAHIDPTAITVDEMARELTAALAEAGRITFRRLTEGLSRRVDVVVRFLALLELISRGRADVEQSRAFDEIIIVWTGGRRSA